MLAWLAFGAILPFQTSAIVGNVRIEALSATLLRLEERGPRGFENRTTFTVVRRDWPGASVSLLADGDFCAGEFVVKIPHGGVRLAGTRVYTSRGRLAFECKPDLPVSTYLPNPAHMPAGFVVADSPRVVPPPWGATPAPDTCPPELKPTSGWDLSNPAPDVYVFLGGPGRYSAFRREFLRLTGPIPMPPMYAFGFIDSLRLQHDDTQALDSMVVYRNLGIPVGTFVCDTDSGVTGSTEYDPSPQYFPAIRRFITKAHDLGVHLMLNDHPGHYSPGADTPEQTKYRWDGLTSLLALGLDAWRYDRNGSTSHWEPGPGLQQNVWAQAIYRDTTQRFRPNDRPFTISNADGVDNGFRISAPNYASHRYPIWWTGNTTATWPSLHKAIGNAVNSGVESMLPYVIDDLGGQTDRPTSEMYVRYLEYSCLSSIARVPCALDQDRHPWSFGAETQRIATDYIMLRCRLLPTIYAAARQCAEDGTPLLRRCDLDWPQYPEAAADDQYLLGRDLLVAPIERSMSGSSVGARKVWLPPGQWQDVWTGRIAVGPSTIEVKAPLRRTPIFVRQGSIVFLAPPMQGAAMRPWDSITVDAFVPARVGASTRELYEDDGTSNGYVRAGFSKTTATLVRQATNAVSLTVGAARGRYAGMSSQRSWIVRLHFEEAESGGFEMPVRVSLDGRVMKLGSYYARVLTASRDSNAMPFGGPGARPQSGAVLEIKVARRNKDRGFTISVRTKVEFRE